MRPDRTALPDSPGAVLAHAPAVDTAVRDEVARLAATLRTTDTALGPVADALVATADGGKRLRGALVCWSYVAHGGRTVDDVLGAACAVELVHLSALIHDDVIDRADTRRGRPSVHARFTDATHGTNVAILLGDVVLAAAPAALEGCTVPGPARDAARAALVRLQVEVGAGQLLDVDAAAGGDADVARALTIATLKSGRYSVGRPLELGALLAGTDAATATGLLRVGDPLGVAFQLRDDLLGVFGDPAETGKPTGADLVEGKRTVLVAETLARLDAAGRDAFETDLGQDDPAVIERLRATITSSGATAAVEARLSDLVAEVGATVPTLPLGERDLAALAALAGWAATRAH